MAGKNFWQEKWQNDQYNQRNPGQANHPDSRRGPQTVAPPARTCHYFHGMRTCSSETEVNRLSTSAHWLT